MPFSADVKAELARTGEEHECCQRAMVASIILGQGRLVIDEDRPWCVLETTSAACVRLLLRWSRRFGNPPITWAARKSAPFREGMRYVVRVGPVVPEHPFFEQLGIARGEGEGWGGFESAWVKKRCCKRAFVRGAFLAGGSVGHPARCYHIEWVARDAVYLEALRSVLQDLALPVRGLARSYHTALYLKCASDIARALTLMGATRSLLFLEEVRAVRETKNLVHRRVNCETANLDRTTRTAVRQIAEIRFLQNRMGLRNLAVSLQIIARARLRYPEASYSELGQRLDPPQSRVAVGRGLQQLERMAVRLRGADGVAGSTPQPTTVGQPGAGPDAIEPEEA